jgi:acyl-CoA synthetase (NDP forming)
MNNCARAIVAMAEYRALREQRSRVTESEPRPASIRIDAAGTVLCEYEAAPLLARCGIAMPAAELTTNAQEAVAAASKLGGCVALKVQSPDIPHKNHAAAVALNVEGAQPVARAYEAVLAGALRHRPDADIRGVLVQKMAPAGIEMIVGAKRDPVFGAMLMVGFGGIQAEVLRDTALAPAPVSIAEARELIGRLRALELLAGADIEALAATTAALSTLALSEAVAEVDLNPVIVHSRGNGVSVVDALIVKRQDGRNH